MELLKHVKVECASARWFSASFSPLGGRIELKFVTELAGDTAEVGPEA
jgi:hypothetical protein